MFELAGGRPLLTARCRRSSLPESRRGAQRLPRHPHRLVCIAALTGGSTAEKLQTVTCTFKCLLKVAYGENVRLVGSHEVLGKWDVQRGCDLKWTDGNVWTATLEVPVGEELQFKFVHVRPGRSANWESTPNRTLLPSPAAGSSLLVSTQFNSPMAEYEAKAIAVQAEEALDFLDASYSAMPTVEVGPSTVELAAPVQQQAEQQAEQQQQQAQQEGEDVEEQPVPANTTVAATVASAVSEEGEQRIAEGPVAEAQGRQSSMGAGLQTAQAEQLKAQMAATKGQMEVLGSRMMLEQVKQQMEAAKQRLAEVDARVARASARVAKLQNKSK